MKCGSLKNLGFKIGTPFAICCNMFLILLGFLSWIFPGCGPIERAVRDLPIPGETPKASATSQNSGKPLFRILHLDVGQGDAALLIAPDQSAALIDTGPPEIGAKTILSVLRDQKIETLQTIFISHDHLDHRGGLEEIIQNSAGKTAQIIDNANLPVGGRVGLGEVTIEILAGNGIVGEKKLSPEEKRDENNRSHALLTRFRRFRHFSAGDLPGGGGNPPYQTIDLETPLLPLLEDVDILKVSHHGSHTATFDPFLEALTPEVAVISVGDRNDFFHPHPSLIDRLLRHGIAVYQTEEGWPSNDREVSVLKNHICIVTDGENYRVKSYGVDRCAPQF